MYHIKDFLSQFSRNQLVIFGIFILILISIPTAMLIARNSWDQNTLDYQPVTTAREVPAQSPLDQLRGLIGDLTPTPATPINTANLGPSLNLKIQLQGRTNFQNQAKIFIGISKGETVAHPKFLLTFSADFSPSGEYSGLSLAGLNIGDTYTAYIKGPGQIDSSSTFTMGSTDINLNNAQPITLLSGDLNEDNQVTSADSAILNNLFGTTPTSSYWNEEADFNLDGTINLLDTSILMSNLGKMGVSGAWQSTPYPSTPSASTSDFNNSNVGGAVEESTSSGGYWVFIPKIDKTSTDRLK